MNFTHLSPWLTAIGIIAVFIVVIAAFLFVDSSYERKENRAFKHSVRIREHIGNDVDAVQRRISDHNLYAYDTPEITTLKTTLANINAAIKDGRRSTEYVKKLHKQLPTLEEQAFASADLSRQNS